jgi:hypothetical protein
MTPKLAFVELEAEMWLVALLLELLAVDVADVSDDVEAVRDGVAPVEEEAVLDLDDLDPLVDPRWELDVELLGPPLEEPIPPSLEPDEQPTTHPAETTKTQSHARRMASA